MYSCVRGVNDEDNVGCEAKVKSYIFLAHQIGWNGKRIHTWNIYINMHMLWVYVICSRQLISNEEQEDVQYTISLNITLNDLLTHIYKYTISIPIILTALSY